MSTSDLAPRILQLNLNEVRDDAKRLQVDFHTLVVSRALEKAIQDVTPTERQVAKTTLFAYTYGSSGASYGSSVKS